MKVLPMFFSLAALCVAPAMYADTIPYPNLGTIAPTVTTTAAGNGPIDVYFAGTTADFTDYVELLDVATGYNSGLILENHASTLGQQVVVGSAPGQIDAGDQLVFYISSPEAPNGAISGSNLYASIPAYSADGVNHAYITNYSGTGLGGGIPAGTYVGLEDEPNGHSDFSYQDDTFVFTNVATNLAQTPEPSSLALLGAGLLPLAAVVRRRFVRS